MASWGGPSGIWLLHWMKWEFIGPCNMKGGGILTSFLLLC